MADLTKVSKAKLERGQSVTILTYASEQYIKTYDKGTAAGTTFKLNGTGSDITLQSNETYTQAVPEKVRLTGETFIRDNTGSIYKKLYLAVHEDLTNGLVGTHPKGRRP